MRGWRVRARVHAVRAAARAEAAEDAGPGWELDPDSDPLRWLPAGWDADPDPNPGTGSSLDPGEGGGVRAAPQQGASERGSQQGPGSRGMQAGDGPAAWQHVPADSQLGPGSQAMQAGGGPAHWQRVPAADSAFSKGGLDGAGIAALEAGSPSGHLPAEGARHQVAPHAQQCLLLQCYTQCSVANAGITQVFWGMQSL